MQLWMQHNWKHGNGNVTWKEEYECGLCESKFKSEEEIDTHLKTYEVYECAECYTRYKTLEETKNDLKNYHETEEVFQSFHHLKMERDDISKVKFKRYFLSEVWIRFVIVLYLEKCLDKTC